MWVSKDWACLFLPHALISIVPSNVNACMLMTATEGRG